MFSCFSLSVYGLFYQGGHQIPNMLFRCFGSAAQMIHMKYIGINYLTVVFLLNH